MNHSHIYAWPHIVDGTIIGEIRRYVKDNGKKSDIPCYTPAEVGFAAGIPDYLKPLKPFGLDSVTHLSELIIVCEGQKTQTAWATLGFQAVTSILGGSNAKGTDWSVLRSAKQICFCPDNDSAGEKYVREICGILSDTQSEKWVCRFPGLVDKGDVCDWLKAQPELSNWNEYDPLTDHPKQQQIFGRLVGEVLNNRRPVPSDWLINWPEPEAIESRLEPVEKMTGEMLPPALRKWIEDAAYRIEVPIDYVAIGAVLAAASAVGTNCKVRPRNQDDWEITPNMWGCVIGPPGDGKSPALREAIFALEVLEHEAAQEASQTQREYESKSAVHDAQVKRIKDEINRCIKGGANAQDLGPLEEELQNLPEPTKPNASRFVANDTTVEALISLLKDNPRGLLMFADELVSLLESWEKQGHEMDRSFFLQCWSGNGRHRQDRIGRGSIVADKLCLSILGGIQEDMLRQYLTSIAATKNDGLIQRFQLMIYPDSRPINLEDIDVAADREAKHRAFAVFRDLVGLNPLQYGAHQEGDSVFFRFSPEAQELYREWLVDLKVKINQEENPLVREHLSKYRSLMPSLALTFHLIDCVGRIRHGDIFIECAHLAAAWCEYLEDHARRVYGLLKAREESSAAVLADKIRRGLLPQRFTERMVMRKHWASLSRKELITPALNVLIEAGWLRKSITQTGGHPLIEFSINPKIEISNVHKVSLLSPVSR